MPRYFLSLAYNGATFNGWQRQPGAPSVQQSLEEAISLMLRTELVLLGCGRTDTGVHADDYFAHFDFEGSFPTAFLARLNRFLPASIRVKALYRCPDATHARFDASSRSYRYELSLHKDPFRQHTVAYIPLKPTIDTAKVQQTAKLIGRHQAFAPFCKTNSDAKTMRCEISHSEWIFGEQQWTYQVSANRFLRGMIRLIVGACLDVGQGKMPLEAVALALEKQQPLPRSWSVPGAGLYLTDIVYPQQSTWVRIEP